MLRQAALVFGLSGAMEEVSLLSRRFAGLHEPVLILGEPGTGKSLLAEYIHSQSPRSRTGEFVDCAVSDMPRGLVLSHLAGHRKGAFTGAVDSQQGKVEAAHRGTLFLDELGLARREVQGLLLTLVSRGTVTRVGDVRPLPVDVRLIAATNADLGQLIGAGKFRQDLRDRFGYWTVRVPPLRERPEDILPLATHFLASDATQLGRRVPEVAVAVQKHLVAAPWPGNVRQLAMLCRFALIAAENDCRIEPEDLPLEFREENGVTIRRRTRRVTRERIAEVVASVSGNRHAAARILRIDRRQVQRVLNA